jgi:hypothetical protein
VGPFLMAVGAVGEFAPIALLALCYSEGAHSGRTTVVFPLVGLRWARMDTKAVSAEAI